MNTPRPRILFLSHSASRNGASILLLHFLKWLKQHAKYEIEVLFTGKGPLLPEFRAVGRTFVWRRLSERLSAVTRKDHTNLKRFDQMVLRMLLRGRRFDVVHANTAATWPAVCALQGQYGPLIWHIHELSYALHASIGAARAKQLFPLAARFISVSQSVTRVLTNEFRVPVELIEMIHEFIPALKVTGEGRAEARRHILSRLDWPRDSFVVGGCGALGWRKGTDLFLQMARRIVVESPQRNFRFLWVGGGDDGEDESLRFAYEVKALGLQSRCQRIPTTADVQSFYSAMDVFALTSREDPFPLVMLEAGAVGLPLVCFADSGGGPEFANGATGLVVPYLDVAAFAAQLMNLQADVDLRHRLGVEAARRVQCNHTVETQGLKLLQSIERCLAPK